MKVAACQAPLPTSSFAESIAFIKDQVSRCEATGVEILCCPEAILGGLADNIPSPSSIAIDVDSGQLEEVLAPLSSKTVSTIIGFTESTSTGDLSRISHMTR